MMQFYTFEGRKKKPEVSAKKPDMFEKRVLAEEIQTLSSDFNRKLRRKAYVFVSSDGTTVKGGAIINEGDPEKHIKGFLKALKYDLSDIEFEEITFEGLSQLLNAADRRCFIDDRSWALDEFDLDILPFIHRQGVSFDESLIADQREDEVREMAEKLLMTETLIPELDRIYAGAAHAGAVGHPVHYMILVDDPDTRRTVCQLLLAALHANGRIRNRRYCYIDMLPRKPFSQAALAGLYSSCSGGTVILRGFGGDDAEDDLASGTREGIERLCEVVKRYRDQVLTIFCLPRACPGNREVFLDKLGNITLVEITGGLISGEKARLYLKEQASQRHVRTDKKLFADLDPDKGYIVSELRDMFDEWYDLKLKTTVYPQYGQFSAIRHETVKSAPRGTAYDELREMIGLAEAKKIIDRALNYYKIQKLYAEAGVKQDRPAMHMVFTGNPGTAKTSVARLFARIMRDNDILPGGKLIEVGRGDLVGKYVGWTAQIIQRKFEEAKGGVLFIDEAYSLVDDRDGSYGDEAINTIVQEMENHRNDMIVIFAGYPDKMEEFLNKNPGLRSRIAFHIPFNDYDTDELLGIAGMIAKQKGMTLTGGAVEKMRSVFDDARSERDFGNGRYARSVIEQAKMAQASRLLNMDPAAIKRSDLVTLEAEDIEMPPGLRSKQKKRIGFRE